MSLLGPDGDLKGKETTWAEYSEELIELYQPREVGIYLW